MFYKVIQRLIYLQSLKIGIFVISLFKEKRGVVSALFIGLVGIVGCLYCRRNRLA